MKYILGIDQGGTKTAVALMDESGQICGTGMEQGAYFPEEGIPSAMEKIERAVLQATEHITILPNEIIGVVGGITGVDWPGDEKAVQKALQELTGVENVVVCNDCVIAMYGGTCKETGAVICAGTGLNCAIRRKQGDTFVYGDYLGSDMQGGGALARRGARMVFDGELGLNEASALKELYLTYANVDTVDQLLKRYMQDETFGREMKLIVPQLITLATQGDRDTNTLLKEFAEDMSRYLYSGMKKMEMLDQPEDIVLAGSVFKGEGNPLTLALTEKLQEMMPCAKVIYARYEPVIGACIMGMQQQHQFSERMRRNLENSAVKYGMLR